MVWNAEQVDNSSFIAVTPEYCFNHFDHYGLPPILYLFKLIVVGIMHDFSIKIKYNYKTIFVDL